MQSDWQKVYNPGITSVETGSEIPTHQKENKGKKMYFIKNTAPMLNEYSKAVEMSVLISVYPLAESSLL